MSPCILLCVTLCSTVTRCPAVCVILCPSVNITLCPSVHVSLSYRQCRLCRPISVTFVLMSVAPGVLLSVSPCVTLCVTLCFTVSYPVSYRRCSVFRVSVSCVLLSVSPCALLWGPRCLTSTWRHRLFFKFDTSTHHYLKIDMWHVFEPTHDRCPFYLRQTTPHPRNTKIDNVGYRFLEGETRFSSGWMSSFTHACFPVVLEIPSHRYSSNLWY